MLCYCNNFDSIGFCCVCKRETCTECDRSDNKADTTICEDCMAAREESPMFKVAKAHCLAAEVLIDPRFIRDLQWL
jgi:hypothetical protein